MNSLIIYIDTWCPQCVRFGDLIKSIDILKVIQFSDIRNYEDVLVCKEKGLRHLASINSQSNVFYGFDSIWQIVRRLPMIWLLAPFFFILKVSRLGYWIYNSLAVKRQIIPLHCSKKDCITN